MKILIAVVAYNEEKNIRSVIEDLQENNFGYDIVVIDNGSYDRTVDVCRSLGIKTVSHCTNTGGQNGTLKTYLLYAFRNNYDIVCQFDGDGQHNASELTKIIAPIRDDSYDYVIGSRFIKKHGFQSSFTRRLGIRFYSRVNSIILGQRITDATSGFRACGKKIITFFARIYRHEFYGANQMILLSHFIGSRIMEVPVIMNPRKHGESRFGALHSVSFMLRNVIIILGSLLQRHSIKRLYEDTYGT